MRIASEMSRLGLRTQGLVTWGELRAAGIGRASVHRALTRGELLRIHRRVYSLQALPLKPRFTVTELGPAPAYVAHVRAVLLSLGPRAAASGRTAAALWGWPMLVEPSRIVDVAVDHGRDEVRVARVRATQRRDVARALVLPLRGAAGMWVTSAVQTVLDCALELPLVEAVVICDSALRAGDVTLEALIDASASMPGVADAKRIRRLLGLVDPRSGSVLESVLRVRLALAGVLDVKTQQVLRTRAGARVLRVDFCFDKERLVIEVDGQKWHQDPPRDRRLDNQLAAAGWRVLRYTWAEVVHEGSAVVAEVLDALGCGTAAVQVSSADAA